MYYIYEKKNGNLFFSLLGNKFTCSLLWPRSLGIIWRNLDESGGIYERKTLFQMKKEADQTGFKGT